MNIDNPEVVVSKKYARAILNSYALSYADIRHIEHLGIMIKQNTFIMALFKFPSTEYKYYQENLVSRVKNFGFPKNMHILIDVLGQKRRLFLLPVICYWIAIYFREKHSIIQFLITSSQDLSFKDKETIDLFLKKSTQSTVELSYHVDYNLIAGLRMQSDMYVWEKSIAQKLRDVQLKNTR